MARTRLRWLLLAAWALPLLSCRSAVSSNGGDVRLVVLISVDQLPYYLLERYDSLFTGGFRRLLDDGRIYTRAVHDHAFTLTSPGHATLATGVVPARHGIVANLWRERSDGGWRRVVSVTDSQERIVGSRDLTGVSPRNLEAAGLADWLLAADPEARVVSVAGKRTSAVLLAGRVPSAYVYYFEARAGRFVTSTYYRQSDPAWVERFNRSELPGFFGDSVWGLAVRAERRRLARRDAAPYENDGRHTTFPHRFSDEVGEGENATAFYGWWRWTPALDEATLALAETAVTALSLGGRDGVDYLAVGLSQLDRVGHRYGPYSLEQLDAILRLDRWLGEFLDFLDRSVGTGRYVVALSSDHGVAPIPEYRQERGEPGRRVTAAEARAVLEAAEAATAARAEGSNGGSVTEALERFDFIADAMTVDELSGSEPADSFVALYRRSSYPGRVPGSLAPYGVVVRLTEWTLSSLAERATHGSPYFYDRHVPMVFLGPGISPGESDDPVRTVDVAPTLARLAGIPYPGDLDGRPLLSGGR